MTRRHAHAHADDFPTPRCRDLGTSGLELFEVPAAEPVTPIAEASPAARTRARAALVREAEWRRWIDAGKPIALLVVRKHGRVTAELFRQAAEGTPHVLPPSYGEDRTLSYLSAMFAELVRQGHLQKRRRADGSVVKEYSQENRNEQVVYELPNGGALG